MQENFSIQFVSKITGINPHTIRAWEKRYSVVTPNRLDNGRRSYTKEMLDHLKLLNDLVGLGNSISSLAKLSKNDLDEMRINYVAKPSVVERPQKTIDLNNLLQNLLMALGGYKLDIISHELENASTCLNLREFALSVISPLMHEIGNLCNTGQLSIAQEHAISALIKFHVGAILYKNISNNDAIYDENIVICTPETELHEFGILITSLLCVHYKIKFYYLGPNMPYGSVIETAKQINAQKIILGLSRNMVNSEPLFLQGYLRKIRGELPENIDLWIGGYNWTEADAFSNIKCVTSLQMIDMELAKIGANI
jgi:DNA-binding transcriptional MerR regulator